jgi:CubicO group peptidase (beta-lactamase class C family)
MDPMSTNEVSTRDRLHASQPSIENICKISGTPGISIGVTHHDRLVYSFNSGYSNVETGACVDQDTVFHIASMSKAFTGLALGILVEEGLLRWKTPIRELIPDFKHFNKEVLENTNLVDLMAHRTGLSGNMNLVAQEHGRPSLPQSQTLPFVNSLHAACPFRSRWLYNNWGPAVAALVIERVSGMSWGTFLQERIFQPLGMTRTFTARHPITNNVAEGYIALADASVIRNERPYFEDGQVLAGSVGVQSCVRDLLVFYQALSRAYNDQAADGTTSSAESPIKQLPFIFTPHMSLPDSEQMHEGYGIGLARTQLPGRFGAMSPNGMFTDSAPVAGRGSNQTVWYHDGSLAGFLTSVHMLPESNSVIVVLTNSFANGDTADWVGPMLLECLIDSPIKIDYGALATESGRRCVQAWIDLPELLRKGQKDGTSHRELVEYTGRFFNSAANWFMEIYIACGTLHMCFQGDRSQSYALQHYHDDVFSYPLTQLENAQRGRFPVPDPGLFLLEFETGSELIAVVGIRWRQDPDIPEGTALLKSGASPPTLNLESR